MIEFSTTIDMRRREVQTTFRKNVATFAFDNHQFPLAEALKVSAEEMAIQIGCFLADVVDQIDAQEKGKPDARKRTARAKV